MLMFNQFKIGMFQKFKIHSMRIRYQKPWVDRVWIQWDENTRINFHKIYPCHLEDCFVHPHQTPIRVKIFEGEYKTGCYHFPVYGKLSNFRNIIPVSMFTLTKGSEYEMLTPRDSHFVYPETICYTMMISGTPFINGVKDPNKPLEFENLTPEEIKEIVEKISQS